ncbi:MAG: 2-C-methyl-D-erythritol 2,4-cyclodiphosphate synthase [Candidatus Dadabacteria bacterium]|nr:2-C-methyl-D-erythritol 2,4-cyclodiphosphate synthase [Candidatus Dadabacteria bacterium]NIS07623.1 2-C-methyl-D-erythritol 2,4-cyclodiphosphate synthase [Candidatus Dadabacteria bacterium]NIV42077.1 2-C-methyl-D-erythritol 2,4-cyclodiphosphate synthase [Candidatus Dadabacteria bacterium]NIX16482.1 2-C-methyl-D-erythritol 2,4-cyclodiphosphate synthase [Candidatus Dadabacteria bacterium]NIY21261.1 2-C-methyl-D-erythritol 2,4-cyclodiphosphate synthase [Candidatus Dadabacteria bacterium]
MYRIGNGFDAHKFAKGRKLIIGGVEIPYEFGLSGHSDADVLCHCICDALLGASNTGDLGKHFSSSDKRFKDISSLSLLEQSYEIVKSKGFVLENIDTTIICEKPKLSGFTPKMVKNISNSTGVSESAISIKATTTDGLGYTGRGEGIAAYAAVLLKKADKTLSGQK